MGTNYYFKPSEKPLNDFKEIHIGKSSAGWEFCFQAYKIDNNPVAVEINNSGLYLSVTPPALYIRSYKDWIRLLNENKGEIVDEYGETISLEEFTSMVSSLAPGKTGYNGVTLLNHYDEILRKQNMYGPVDPELDWKDSEGFSFSLRAFS